MSQGILGPDINVDNVYIYLADAVRWDSLPETVRSAGSSFKTVAASCATMRAVSSIITGLNAPAHGVRSWTDRLTEPSLLGLEDVNTGYYNPAGGDSGGLNSVLNRESENQLEDIEPPFVYFERDQGGHAPYAGMSYEEMLTDLDQSSAEIQSRYADMVSRSTDRFSERLEVLSNRGLRDSTLIIYLGDHGELLGEQGLVSHSSPIMPELVYVPTVFIHPDLENTDVQSETIGQIDIAPTVLDALGESSSELSPTGVSLFSNTPGARYTDSIHTQSFGGKEREVYRSESLWDESGGHIFTSAVSSFLSPAILAKKAQGWNRKYLQSNPGEIPAALKCMSARHRVSGRPGFSESHARDTIEEIRETKSSSESVDLDEDIEERLEDLGYR
ncbi:sulfatase-like hydrolase/transferase [Halobacterium hubeiense]|uniref:sulfatase-like hydrolase/transferase n=1 Tax=Halobacterium hubeiense TaxID=1407499 RepID=UPI000B7FBC08|nr:sulfatase-like hydrolase/transferase [Halobacterium hubeiense]